MERTGRKSNLERQLYRSFLLISTLMILFSLTITLYLDLSRQQRDTDGLISGTAAYIASLPDVVSMIKTGYPDTEVSRDLDSLCSTIPNISVVVISDKNGLRFYHTDRLKTGDSLVDGEETEVLNGAEPYITTGYGTMGSQRRAFHAVKTADGSIIGFVCASVFTNHISIRARNIVLAHLAILAGMLLVSLLLTHAIMGYLKKSLMGFHPNELLNLYIKQDEVLNAVEEGLIASDTGGTILFVNTAAKKLLSGEGTGAEKTGAFHGTSIRASFPDTKFDAVLKTGEPGFGTSSLLNGRTVVVNEIPIRVRADQPVQGVLTILYDRTEIQKISDELSGARSMLDTLRSFNHEFLNKLHIILGYLQTGNTEAAIRFIMNSSLVTSQSVRQTADCIRDSRICALVIGKMMHAAELGILLTVSPDSVCTERDLLLSEDSYITIIGNLLENSIEELSAGEREIREIKLGLYFRPDCSLIVCEDTGGSIEPAILGRIFEKGVSSKGGGRGTGLYLIRQIAEKHGGTINVDTEPGEGTCFTIAFTRKETGTCTR